MKVKTYSVIEPCGSEDGHEVVAPLIVADYITYSRQLKNARSKEVRINLLEARDSVWSLMTTDAQWLAVDILSNRVKYTVTVDE